MTLTQIEQLTIEDCQETLLSRLEVETATQEQLEAEFEVYKAELIAEEEARLAEVERIADLKSRFSQLTDSGLIQKQGIQNPAAYFRDEILNNSDKEEAENKLAQIEISYQSDLAKLSEDLWLKNRQSEYSKIDKMLLEALAEKENGDDTRMNEYLVLRAQIKSQFPKP